MNLGHRATLGQPHGTHPSRVPLPSSPDDFCNRNCTPHPVTWAALPWPPPRQLGTARSSKLAAYSGVVHASVTAPHSFPSLSSTARWQGQLGTLVPRALAARTRAGVWPSRAQVHYFPASYSRGGSWVSQCVALPNVSHIQVQCPLWRHSGRRGTHKSTSPLDTWQSKWHCLAAPSATKRPGPPSSAECGLAVS